MNVTLPAILTGKSIEMAGKCVLKAFGPVTGYFCMLTAAAFFLFAGAADAGETREVSGKTQEVPVESLEVLDMRWERWEIYENIVRGYSRDSMHGGDTGYIMTIYRLENELSRVTLQFVYFSKDGQRTLAGIRGDSVGPLVPLPEVESCFYAKLYENFSFSRSDYIICEEEEKILVSNIDINSPPVMPGHLVLTKVSKPVRQ